MDDRIDEIILHMVRESTLWQHGYESETDALDSLKSYRDEIKQMIVEGQIEALQGVYEVWQHRPSQDVRSHIEDTIHELSKELEGGETNG